MICAERNRNNGGKIFCIKNRNWILNNNMFIKVI